MHGRPVGLVNLIMIIRAIMIIQKAVLKENAKCDPCWRLIKLPTRLESPFGSIWTNDISLSALICFHITNPPINLTRKTHTGGRTRSEKQENNLNWSQSTCWSQHHEKQKGTGQSESKQDLQSAASKSPLSMDPPSPSTGLGTNAVCQNKHKYKYKFIIQSFLFRPPPAPVGFGFGSQGSRRATYHNPYLVSSISFYPIYCKVSIHRIRTFQFSLVSSIWQWKSIYSITKFLSWISRYHWMGVKLLSYPWPYPYHIYIHGHGHRGSYAHLL